MYIPGILQTKYFWRFDNAPIFKAIWLTVKDPRTNLLTEALSAKNNRKIIKISAVSWRILCGFQRNLQNPDVLCWFIIVGSDILIYNFAFFNIQKFWIFSIFLLLVTNFDWIEWKRRINWLEFQLPICLLWLHCQYLSCHSSLQTTQFSWAIQLRVSCQFVFNRKRSGKFNNIH